MMADVVSVEKTETKTVRSDEPVFNHDALIFGSNEEVVIKRKNGEKDEDDETQRDKIIRLVVIVLVVLIILLSSSRLVFWLLQPATPVVHLHSFSLSKLNESNTQLSVDWSAKFTVVNPDHRYSLIFSETFCYFTYRDRQVSGKVGEEYDKKFTPTQKGEINFVSKGGIKELDDDDRAMFEQIKDSVKKGRPVNYEINLLASVVALADSWWDRKTGFHMSCGALPMKFAPKLDSAAALIEKNGQPCVITQYGTD